MHRRCAAVFALLALVSGCGDGTSAAGRGGRPESAPADVRLVAAATTAFERTVHVTGTLAADEDVVLAFKVPGRLLEIGVDLGSRVKKGDVVARLDPTDFELRVKQAEAAVRQARVRLGLPAEGGDDAIALDEMSGVRQAEATLAEMRAERERTRSLYEQKLVPKSDFDRMEAAYLVAESRRQDALEEAGIRQALLVQRRSDLAIAEQALRDSALASPLDGAVRRRHASPGEYLAVGAPVATIVRTHPLRLRLAVPEREALSLSIGLRVNLRVEGDPATYEGRVVRLSPALSEPDRTLLVEAEVPNESGALRPGSFARAEIVAGRDDSAVAVPETAVVSFAGIEKVFGVSDGRAVERRVETGRRKPGLVEIVRGLAAGDEIVEAPGNLVSGAPVVVVEASR